MPVENIALYFHSKRMEDDKKVADYIFNGGKKMVCCPANVMLRLELQVSTLHVV